MKYNEDIDRESAYELLNEKIKKAEALKAKEEARLEQQKETQRRSKTRSRTRTRTRRSTRQNPIVKVLTSATFMRAVFGILKKVI